MKFKPFQFILDAYRELTHVVWPSRPEVIRKTLLVVTTIVLGGAIIGALDYVLVYGVRTLISLR